MNLIVIAKAPAAGRSKTRLCPPCTAEQAADLAEAALSDTLAAVAATPAARRVLVLDGEPGAWLPAGWTWSLSVAAGSTSAWPTRSPTSAGRRS